MTVVRRTDIHVFLTQFDQSLTGLMEKCKKYDLK